MSLKKSSLFALALLFVIFMASTLSNLWLLTRSNHSLDNVNAEIRVVLSIIDPINHSRTLRVRAMEYMKAVASGNTQEATPTLAGVKEAAAKADSAFQSYLKAPKQSEEASLANDYRNAWLAYRQQGLQPLIDAAEAHNQPAFEAQISKVAQLDQQYEIVLDKVLALHEAYARDLNSQAQSHFNFGIGLITAFALLFLLVIVAVLMFLRRYVLTPLNSARERCREIAEGALDTPVPVRAQSRSEIDDVLRSMEQMRLALTDIIGQVRDSSHTVAAASQQIAAGNVDLASRTEQQAAALTETAASMEELGATVQQNTGNVLQASRLTREAVENARAGEQVAQEVITTMSRIISSSKQIEDITSVINSIAFQTNILALNAAVEAARAGEQGRGFAVVAGEVRNLAQRSAVAAKEIETLISESVNNIQTGSNQVSRTGEAIAAIITSVTQVNTLMEQISVASDEQSRGIRQIEQAVNEMDSVTQQNAALVQESAAAAASLEDQVHHLTHSVSTFRLAMP
ncbi:methyl-accepting chemotaxis protein [[Erwinia] mediterraneensis]|uniref:methyl-accepting chemotaxis protein n=1 Tax=[Erwinia] mediterraneensis TaxID=2161819 RepID=UPI00102F5E33|nr:methyl-accepting chemotaxis protein [[Erwinia] mediterraneensis]